MRDRFIIRNDTGVEFDFCEPAFAEDMSRPSLSARNAADQSASAAHARVIGRLPADGVGVPLLWRERAEKGCSLHSSKAPLQRKLCVSSEIGSTPSDAPLSPSLTPLNRTKSIHTCTLTHTTL